MNDTALQVRPRLWDESPGPPQDAERPPKDAGRPPEDATGPAEKRPTAGTFRMREFIMSRRKKRNKRKTLALSSLRENFLYFLRFCGTKKIISAREGISAISFVSAGQKTSAGQ